MIYARRYTHWTEVPAEENTALLDGFVAHPEFLSYPHSIEDARVVAAALLTDPSNLIWTTYDNRLLTGCVILTRIVPRIDALLHFLFLDNNLAGKRKLLKNVIGYCFTDLGFNRLSMEVPEGVRLERFARKVLSFRLEGENRPRNQTLPVGLSDNWVARQGSRREQSYFDGADWKDVMLLRVLACEWVGEQGGRECHYQQSSEPPHPSPEASSVEP